MPVIGFLNPQSPDGHAGRLRGLPPASVTCSRGGSTAGPFHYRTGRGAAEPAVRQRSMADLNNGKI